jgi:hypothetical protein
LPEPDVLLRLEHAGDGRHAELAALQARGQAVLDRLSA